MVRPAKMQILEIVDDEYGQTAFWALIGTTPLSFLMTDGIEARKAKLGVTTDEEAIALTVSLHLDEWEKIGYEPMDQKAADSNWARERGTPRKVPSLLVDVPEVGSYMKSVDEAKLRNSFRGSP